MVPMVQSVQSAHVLQLGLGHPYSQLNRWLQSALWVPLARKFRAVQFAPLVPLRLSCQLAWSPLGLCVPYFQPDLLLPELCSQVPLDLSVLAFRCFQWGLSIQLYRCVRWVQLLQGMWFPRWDRSFPCFQWVRQGQWVLLLRLTLSVLRVQCFRDIRYTQSDRLVPLDLSVQWSLSIRCFQPIPLVRLPPWLHWIQWVPYRLPVLVVPSQLRQWVLRVPERHTEIGPYTYPMFSENRTSYLL